MIVSTKKTIIKIMIIMVVMTRMMVVRTLIMMMMIKMMFMVYKIDNYSSQLFLRKNSISLVK